MNYIRIPRDEDETTACLKTISVVIGGTCALCHRLCFVHDCFQDRNILLGTFILSPNSSCGKWAKCLFPLPSIDCPWLSLSNLSVLASKFMIFFLVLSNGMRESHHVENCFICLCIHSDLWVRTHGHQCCQLLAPRFYPYFQRANNLLYAKPSGDSQC